MKRKYDISKETALDNNLIAFESSNKFLLMYNDFYFINDRLLFPFRDHENGHIVGYQARLMNQDSKKKYVKYINLSDYGEIITKGGTTYRTIKPFVIGNFLFNLLELKEKQISRLFITEGVADAIKLQALGYDTISPGQPNLTVEQIYLISKYFGKDIQLVLFFDNDSNSVGQNKSLMNAYKLYQYGFKNLKIVRTYAELGTDVTDVATKIRNDATLVTLIELWLTNAYPFIPASDEDLNTLYQTGLFSEKELLRIDPRNVSVIINKATSMMNVYNTLKINKTQSNNQLMMIADKKFLELINEKVDDQIKTLSNVSNVNSFNVIGNLAKTNYESQSLTYDWSIITNITRDQLYHLKKKFDYEMIKKIDESCSKVQIRSIVGRVIKKDIFDIQDYFRYKKPKSTITKIRTNKDGFIDVSNIDEDDMPF